MASRDLPHVLPSRPATPLTGSALQHLLALDLNIACSFRQSARFPCSWTYLIAFGVIYNILVVQIDLSASRLPLLTSMASRSSISIQCVCSVNALISDIPRTFLVPVGVALCGCFAAQVV